MQRRWWDKSEGPITFQANQQIRKPTAHSASEERRTSGPSLPALRSHSPDLLPGSGPPQRVQTEEKRGTVGPTVSDSGCCCTAEENIGLRGHRFDLYTDKLVCFFVQVISERKFKMDSQKCLVPMVTYRWTLRERIVNVWCLVLFSSLLRSVHMNSMTGFWILLSVSPTRNGKWDCCLAWLRLSRFWPVARTCHHNEGSSCKTFTLFLFWYDENAEAWRCQCVIMFCFVCWKPAKLDSP